MHGDSAGDKRDDVYAWDGQWQPACKGGKHLRFPLEIETCAVVSGDANDQITGVKHQIVLSGIDDHRRQDFRAPEGGGDFI
ncbi:hypothetical protein D3C87_1944430 [compost metagenome]